MVVTVVSNSQVALTRVRVGVSPSGVGRQKAAYAAKSSEICSELPPGGLG